MRRAARVPIIASLLLAASCHPRVTPREAIQSSRSDGERAARSPFLAVEPHAASGREYYLAPDGNDGAPGTSAAPWRTLHGAAARMAPGDVAYLRGGTYIGYFPIRSSGAPGAPLTFTAYPGESPLLSAESSGDTIYVSGSHVTLDRLRVKNATNPGKGITIAATAHHVTVSRCEVFETFGQGIVIAGSNNLIERSAIHDNGANGSFDHGIYVIGGDNVIRANVIHDNWTYGVHLYGEDTSASGNIIEDNYIHSNGFGAAEGGYRFSAGIIIARGHRDVIVRRNRSCNNAHYGIIVSDERPGNLITENVTCYNGLGGINMYGPGSDNVLRRNISYNDYGDALASRPVVKSDENVFYHVDRAPSFAWEGTRMSLSDYRAASGQDMTSRIADPRFLDGSFADGFDPAIAERYDFCTPLLHALCR